MDNLIILLVVIFALIALVCYRLTRKKPVTFSPNDTSANEVPDYSDTLEDWYIYLLKTDWKTVYNLKREFIPQALNKHDEKLYQMFHSYLLKTVHPILSDRVIDNITNKTIWVKDNATDEEIKQIVQREWNEKLQPSYVISTSKEFIGFALSPTLIIYGITPVTTYPLRAILLAKDWKKSFLTKEDSHILEANLDELNSMADQIDVPNQMWDCWLLQNDKNASIYDGYRLSNSDRYTYFEEDDTTPIIVKL